MAPSRDGPTWYQLFKTNHVLKKRLRKLKKSHRRDMRSSALLRDEMDLLVQEKQDAIDRLEALRGEIAAEKESVRKEETDVRSPLMIHLVVFSLLNALFYNHLIGLGIRDPEIVQVAMIMVNMLYTGIVWYAMSV